MLAIPWRYPIVESATAAAFALAYLLFGPTLDFVVAAVLLAALIAITAIDLRHQIIPGRHHAARASWPASSRTWPPAVSAGSIP